jgi:hypothetical protein
MSHAGWVRPRECGALDRMLTAVRAAHDEKKTPLFAQSIERRALVA